METTLHKIFTTWRKTENVFGMIVNVLIHIPIIGCDLKDYFLSVSIHKVVKLTSQFGWTVKARLVFLSHPSNKLVDNY